MRFLMVTDFHLRDPKSSIDAAAHLETIACGLEAAAATHPEAKFFVVAGDITDRGEEEAYRSLKPVLDKLPFPTFLIMGNHDDRRAFRKVFGGHDKFVQSVTKLGEMKCIFLDTLEPGGDGGFLCPERLGWVRREVADAVGRPVLLFLHHPPCDIGDPKIDNSRLANPDDLADALADANAVQIFFGHVHRTVTTSWRGVPAMALARPSGDLPVLAVDILGDRVSCTVLGTHR